METFQTNQLIPIYRTFLIGTIKLFVLGKFYLKLKRKKTFLTKIHFHYLIRYTDPNIGVNTCNLFAGSSSAFVHRIGAEPNTFVGIHIGGDFMHCSNCLSIPPTNRHCLSHNEALTSCTNCRSSGCTDCRFSKGRYEH